MKTRPDARIILWLALIAGLPIAVGMLVYRVLVWVGWITQF